MENHQGLFFGDVAKNWIWLLVLGIIFIILGFFGLGRLFALTVASVFFFGILILIGGAVQFFESFKCKGWKSVLLHVIIAILYVILGILLIINPLVASVVFTLFLAIGFILVGIFRLGMAIQARGTAGWNWLLFSGILSVLMGLIVAARWPVSGLFIIGLFVAIELIFHGWSYIMLALTARKASNMPTAEAKD
jgi:uncharacterized membrane protein HdeD (DUF308 family)